MSAKTQTLKYATVDGLDMHLEVIVPESATKDNKAPIYLWFVSEHMLEGPLSWPHSCTLQPFHGLIRLLPCRFR